MLTSKSFKRYTGILLYIYERERCVLSSAQKTKSQALQVARSLHYNKNLLSRLVSATYFGPSLSGLSKVGVLSMTF